MRRLILACVATALFAAVPRARLTAQVAAIAVPTPPVAAGGVRILNPSGSALQIELRAAVGGRCAAGPAISRQSIAAGATIVIRSSQPMCIRRPLASVRGAQMTGSWELKPMRQGVIEEVIP